MRTQMGCEGELDADSDREGEGRYYSHTLCRWSCGGWRQCQKCYPMTGWGTIKYLTVLMVQLESIAEPFGVGVFKEGLWTRAVNFLLPRLLSVHLEAALLKHFCLFIVSCLPHCFLTVDSILSRSTICNWTIFSCGNDNVVGLLKYWNTLQIAGCWILCWKSLDPLAQTYYWASIPPKKVLLLRKNLSSPFTPKNLQKLSDNLCTTRWQLIIS